MLLCLTLKSRLTMHYRHFRAVVIALAACSCQAIRLITKDTLPSDSLSRECADALVADVACQRQVVGLEADSEITSAALEETCTASCRDALGKYEASVGAACTESDVYDISETRTAPVSFIPTLLYYQFNKTCIQDTGRWCREVVFGKSSGNEEASTGKEC